jgi:hypothetical protein
LLLQPYLTGLVSGEETLQQQHWLKWFGMETDKYVGEVIGAGLFSLFIGYKIKTYSTSKFLLWLFLDY